VPEQGATLLATLPPLISPHTHKPQDNSQHPPPPPPDFYYELGVQVVEACIASRPFTGGLIELSRVHEFVQVGTLWGGCPLTFPHNVRWSAAAPGEQPCGACWPDFAV
jgi:hypothetical protein